MGSKGVAPPILTSALDGREWTAHAPAALPPRKEAPVPTGYEAGCAPEPVWMLWRKVSFPCKE
jgi:hypothetical protein